MATIPGAEESGERGAASTLARRVPAAFLVVLLALPTIVLAIDGAGLARFVEGRPVLTLRLGPVPAGLLLAIMPLATLLRLVLARRRFGTRSLDRILTLALAVEGLAVLAMELVRLAKQPPAAQCVAALSVATAWLGVALIAAHVVLRLPTRGRALAWLARAGAHVLLSLLVLSVAWIPLEAWLASRPLRDWYSVVALDGSETKLHEDDPDLLWRMAAHFRGRVVHPELGGVIVETNALGLREREIEPLAGRVEGLVLGDSFALGLGVTESEMLSRCLEAEGVADRVWNAGVIGFTTIDELLMLERLSEVVRPSFVVLLVYLGNDLEENQWRLQRFRDEGRTELLSTLFPEALALVEELSGRGLGASVVDYDALSERSRARIKLERRSSTVRALFELFDRAAARRGETPRMPPVNDLLVRSFAVDPDPRVERCLELALAAVRAVAARASALGARTLVCIAPARLQVDLELYRRVLGRLRLEEARYDVGRPQAAIAAGCAAAGIEVLDLTPELRERHRSGERPYFAEGHWNRVGHALAAAAIARRLRAPPQGR